MKKKVIKKDILKRNKFKHKEKKNKIIKFLAYSIKNPYNINFKKKNFLKIFSMKNNSITLIKNRCIITGRSKSIFKKLKISRIILKKIVNEGKIPSIKKK